MVTQTNFTLVLQPGVFTWDNPRAIARSLKASAEASRRRKAAPFQSGHVHAEFLYQPRREAFADRQLRRLEAAKDELRTLFGRPRRG